MHQAVTHLLEVRQQGGGKISCMTEGQLRMTWPRALRAVRAWLEPWIMLQRYWRAWSSLAPPPELYALLEWVRQGQPLYLYDTR